MNRRLSETVQVASALGIHLVEEDLFGCLCQPLLKRRRECCGRRVQGRVRGLYLIASVGLVLARAVP